MASHLHNGLFKRINTLLLFNFKGIFFEVKNYLCQVSVVKKLYFKHLNLMFDTLVDYTI
jgi:hypothetical protein